VSLRKEGVEVKAREKARAWIRVSEADRAALDEYISAVVGLGC
jgi:hypothetical protein